MTEPVTGRRGHRLRHQHHQAADRRRCRTVRGPRDRGWSGSARASTAPAARRRGAGAGVRRDRRVRRADRARTRVERIRFCATSATRDAAQRRRVRRRRPRAARRRARRCCPATRRPRCPSTAPSATCATAARDAGAGRRHRRRLDRADPRRAGAAARVAAAARWTSARCGCTSATSTPTRRRAAEVAAVRRRHRRPPRRLPGRPGAAPRPWSGSPARITTVAAGVLDLPAYDRGRDRPGGAAGRPTCTRTSTGCWR